MRAGGALGGALALALAVAPPGAAQAQTPPSAVLELTPSPVAGKVRLDASKSTGRGPLEYVFDADGDGSFETDTRRTAYVDIPPLTAGCRNWAVQVFDRDGTPRVAGTGLCITEPPARPAQPKLSRMRVLEGSTRRGARLGLSFTLNRDTTVTATVQKRRANGRYRRIAHQSLTGRKGANRARLRVRVSSRGVYRITLATTYHTKITTLRVGR